jgi:hypothetical protein
VAHWFDKANPNPLDGDFAVANPAEYCKGFKDSFPLSLLYEKKRNFLEVLSNFPTSRMSGNLEVRGNTKTEELYDSRGFKRNLNLTFTPNQDMRTKGATGTIVLPNGATGIITNTK